MEDTIILWLAIGLILIGLLAGWFEWNLHRPLTDWDEYCSRVDEELDELWAQEQVRPHGSVERA